LFERYSSLLNDAFERARFERLVLRHNHGAILFAQDENANPSDEVE
jgi:hypothetical protein